MDKTNSSGNRIHRFIVCGDVPISFVKIGIDEFRYRLLCPPFLLLGEERKVAGFWEYKFCDTDETIWEAHLVTRLDRIIKRIHNPWNWATYGKE